jgi:hypothetical protein
MIYNRQGTPPRAKTAARLRIQHAMGWPTMHKTIIRGSLFMHPTKRHFSPGRTVKVLKKHRLPKPEPRSKSPLQAVICSMTNNQRHRYSRTVGVMRRMGLTADKLEVAVFCAGR